MKDLHDGQLGVRLPEARTGNFAARFTQRRRAHVSIEARCAGCTVITTNRESRRRSPEFQREDNNRRSGGADNRLPGLADNRRCYQLDFIG